MWPRQIVTSPVTFASEIVFMRTYNIKTPCRIRFERLEMTVWTSATSPMPFSFAIAGMPLLPLRRVASSSL